jgi:hypothetical protein
MEMSFAPHLELITELMPIIRRDFPLDATALANLNPNGSNPLLDGEWLALNDSYQLTRGALGSGAELGKLSFQLFAERGRYDTQAIGKVPVLFIGGYEAETDIVNSPHGLLVGDPVTVADVVVGGLHKNGLIKATGAGTHWVVGWVTRLPSNGRVRYFKSPGLTYLTI